MTTNAAMDLGTGIFLAHGDCVDVLATLPAGLFHAIVCDPPYGLTFMGKGWDDLGHGNAQQAWHARWLCEAFRVLKPGGHLLAFGGSRTFHRLFCATEDAGFEIRDTIMWLYGSGFPKSYDVSKGIDKSAGRIGVSTASVKQRLREAHANKGWTLADLNAACGFEASGYLRTSSSWRNVLPPDDKWPVLRDALNLGHDMDHLFTAATREIVGLSASGLHRGSGITVAFGEGADRTAVNITAPATPEAETWSGWGTALKPAHEPILLARKPLIGTVAQNVLTHSVGALNIDGCRVGSDVVSTHSLGSNAAFPKRPGETTPEDSGRTVKQGDVDRTPRTGRWPANVILDPEAGSLLDAQTGTLTSRFFYCAKAAKNEKEAGCADLAKRHGRKRGNHHPTVKPVALMEYLIKLVLPDGGLLLDPFAGSGTTLVAAKRLGQRAVGIEQNAEYIEITAARVEATEVG